MDDFAGILPYLYTHIMHKRTRQSRSRTRRRRKLYEYLDLQAYDIQSCNARGMYRQNSRKKLHEYLNMRQRTNAERFSILLVDKVNIKRSSTQMESTLPSRLWQYPMGRSWARTTWSGKMNKMVGWDSYEMVW
eukprot:c53558_g1_i1 orf=284-682(+)